PGVVERLPPRHLLAALFVPDLLVVPDAFPAGLADAHRLAVDQHQVFGVRRGVDAILQPAHLVDDLAEPAEVHDRRAGERQPGQVADHLGDHPGATAPGAVGLIPGVERLGELHAPQAGRLHVGVAGHGHQIRRVVAGRDVQDDDGVGAGAFALLLHPEQQQVERALQLLSGVDRRATFEQVVFLHVAGVAVGERFVAGDRGAAEQHQHRAGDDREDGPPGGAAPALLLLHRRGLIRAGRSGPARAGPGIAGTRVPSARVPAARAAGAGLTGAAGRRSRLRHASGRTGAAVDPAGAVVRTGRGCAVVPARLWLTRHLRGSSGLSIAGPEGMG